MAQTTPSSPVRSNEKFESFLNKEDVDDKASNLKVVNDESQADIDTKENEPV